MEKLEVALYTINKLAKQIRDFREKLKEMLFESDGTVELGSLTEDQITDLKEELSNDMRDLCERLEINLVPFELCGKFYLVLAGKKNQTSDLWDDIAIEYKKSITKIIANIDDENQERIHDVLDLMENPDDVEEVKEFLSEKQINDIVGSWYVYSESLEAYWNLSARTSSLHKALRVLKNIQDSLYELKEKTIKSMKISPVTYHRSSDEDVALALYKIGEFKFHLPVAKDENIKDMIEDEEINWIDSENKLNPTTAIPATEAIKILMDFIGNNLVTTEDILSGKLGLSGLPLYQREKPKRSRKREWFDVDEDYDDYDDMLDDDFFDEDNPYFYGWS